MTADFYTAVSQCACFINTGNWAGSRKAVMELMSSASFYEASSFRASNRRPTCSEGGVSGQEEGLGRDMTQEDLWSLQPSLVFFESNFFIWAFNGVYGLSDPHFFFPVLREWSAPYLSFSTSSAWEARGRGVSSPSGRKSCFKACPLENTFEMAIKTG